MTTKLFHRFIVPALILGIFIFASGTSVFAVPACDWNLQYNPDPDENAQQLRAVWGLSATEEVYAVGDLGRVMYTTNNGTMWGPVNIGIAVNLYGVWGTSSSDVFVVGDTGNIRHFDGSTWIGMSSNTNKRLRDVWGTAANNVIAVGENGTIRRYNGSTWGSMTSSTALTLQAVWGTDANNIYAVGGPSGSATGTGVIIKYNGTSWTTIYTDPTIIRFHGVWGSDADNVFVVGAGGSILHTTDGGANWSTITAPGNPVEDSTVTLRDIWGTSASDIYAVGEGSLSGFGGTIILHFDGSNWNVMNNPISSLPSPADSSSGIKLHSVWGSAANNVFTVGETYIEEDGITKHGTILHYMCGTLISLSSFTATPLNKTVVLEWTTASEIDNAGFNMYRAESKDGEYIKINAELISAQGSSTEGAAYEFVDEDLQNRKSYYYKLEDVDFNGQSTFHGPAKATPRWIYGNK